ncbi:hypothetical protein BOTCAL_0368g00100 [Botryotinia calthae]|uniref:Uncharacterized protein n=1 Tax=Botryotinia calthae TaxID=38488 RepID=A0A4Y8CRW6_9HELO|nr:hypothetical protein BOTCAL_0368g00100 [Botryotinia calthae]
MSPTIVLITGANRDLGKGLPQRYLALPNQTVTAANRDPSHESSKKLFDLRKGSGSILIIVKIEASIEQDAFDAVQELQDKHNIQHIDIVIANAGVSYIWPTVADLKISDLKPNIEPNVYGLISTTKQHDFCCRNQRIPFSHLWAPRPGQLRVNFR